MIDISGLKHTDVLRVLYDRAQTQGTGVLQYTPELMTEKEAKIALSQQGSGRFDYLKGRVMKIRIAGIEIDERLYDRDNGPGAAAQAVEGLRKREVR